MPLYDIRNKNTGAVEEMQMTIAEKEEFLRQNEHLEQVLGMPKIVSGVDGLRKTDDSFRDILRNIDKKHKSRKNTMNKNADF
tara:strand:+ start:3900 stop:4145 length:246 start_codon:yes stop_codon:yes gene_type:complete